MTIIQGAVIETRVRVVSSIVQGSISIGSVAEGSVVVVGGVYSGANTSTVIEVVPVVRGEHGWYPFAIVVEANPIVMAQMGFVEPLKGQIVDVVGTVSAVCKAEPVSYGAVRESRVLIYATIYSALPASGAVTAVQDTCSARVISFFEAVGVCNLGSKDTVKGILTQDIPIEAAVIEAIPRIKSRIYSSEVIRTDEVFGQSADGMGAKPEIQGRIAVGALYVVDCEEARAKIKGRCINKKPLDVEIQDIRSTCTGSVRVEEVAHSAIIIDIVPYLVARASMGNMLEGSIDAGRVYVEGRLRCRV
jgi:hypothetical protein